ASRWNEVFWLRQGHVDLRVGRLQRGASRDGQAVTLTATSARPMDLPDGVARAGFSRERQPAKPLVRLAGISKAYRGVIALGQADFDVRAGEFFTLLGPSGSGKTTTLRLLAGFERPDTGRIELSGVYVTHLPPFCPRHQYGVPGLCAVSAHARRRECRLRPRSQGRTGTRTARARGRGVAHGASGGALGAHARSAFRWAAAA